MARQPLIALLAALTACASTQEWEGTFNIPEAVDVLPSEGNPFDEPVGYAASLHGGRIAVMSLREGRYLADQATSSILRAAPLATGAGRVLGSIAVYAPGDDTVTLYAADRSWRTLVRIPHVTGLDDKGGAVRLPTTLSDVAFVDADGSGDSPQLEDLRPLHGFATTEDWTVTFDGELWWPEGTRSGRLDTGAEPDEEYSNDRGGLAFTARGDATEGDQFTFSTDNGTVEVDVGGTPLHLATSPDQSRIALIRSTDDDAAELAWLNPASGAVLKPVTLPSDATPVRMTWSLDGRLFLADGARSSLWIVTPGDDTDTIEEITLPWPIADAAPLITESGTSVALNPLSSDEVWVYDLEAGALRDLNSFQEGVNGLALGSLIRGVGSIDDAFQWPELDDGRVPKRGQAWAISLQRGEMVYLGEPTGCLIDDSLGPRTSLLSTSIYYPDYEIDPGDEDGFPTLLGNSSNSRSVVVNSCAGIAHSEIWQLEYDTLISAWVVTGSVSGEQRNLAYEDTRYVSDTGAVSFTILSGYYPPEDGWTMSFEVVDGALSTGGDNDGDGIRDISFQLPGDPISYREVKALSDNPWQQVRDQPYVLVPAAGSDLVAKVDPVTGTVEVAWW